LNRIDELPEERRRVGGQKFTAGSKQNTRANTHTKGDEEDHTRADMTQRRGDHMAETARRSCARGALEHSTLSLSSLSPKYLTSAAIGVHFHEVATETRISRCPCGVTAALDEAVVSDAVTEHMSAENTTTRKRRS
jgi:hypothetical protein